jgi:methyl acetate hydrolase
MEHDAMQHKFTRRDVLNSASGLVVATALGGLINNGAVASEELPGHAQEKLTHNQAFAPIDHVLRQAADGKTVAGVVALGATEKGVVYEGAFGKADMNAGSKISADTVFWLLSMTKAITATACMQLIEQGKLQLDQPASQILPELKSPQVLEGFDSGGGRSLAIWDRHGLGR